MKLTPREYEICTRLIYGMTNSQIAEELEISTHTVKAHISNLVKKFNAKNRVELAFILGRENIIIM